MWKHCICVALLLAGCEGGKQQQQAEPSEGRKQQQEAEPSGAAVSWLRVGTDASVTHMTLHADGQVKVKLRQPDRSESKTEWKLPDDRYTEVTDKLRKLDCCSLGTRFTRAPSPGDALTELRINLEGVQCKVSVWDSEWRAGRARECELALAEIRGQSLVPDPPASDPTP